MHLFVSILATDFIHNTRVRVRIYNLFFLSFLWIELFQFSTLFLFLHFPIFLLRCCMLSVYLFKSCDLNFYLLNYILFLFLFVGCYCVLRIFKFKFYHHICTRYFAEQEKFQIVTSSSMQFILHKMGSNSKWNVFAAKSCVVEYTQELN